MAQIIEEILVVKVSKLVRDNEQDVAQLINESTRISVEESIQHLFSDAIIVEVEKKD
jgi:predicted nucleic acid-binding protein